MTTVLVTGGSGFVGVHVVLALLNAGHTVRTTVRSLAREAEVRAMLLRGGVDAGERLSFAEADLMRDEGWADAVTGCEYVHHVASPFPLQPPADENDLIVPAREGTLRVLRAARDAGVKRVIVTSSFAAIGYGHPSRTTPFTEEDWTNIDGVGVSAYTKSKTIAERAAWDFMAREGGAMELSVVNPTGIFGPVLGQEKLSGSIEIIDQMMTGKIPALPDISFGVVDVRDVADMHVRCMMNPAAAGQRFLAVAGPSVSMEEAAHILRDALGPAARRVPTIRIPSWLLRAAAVVIPKFRAATPELGKHKQASNAKAIAVLGWQPRTAKEALIATGESLVALKAEKQGLSG